MKSKGSLNSKKIKNDFPVLNQKVNGQKLHYLDNAATTQKPNSVLESVEEYNKKYNANPHRGAHYLSVQSTEKYEKGRKKVRDFINADSTKEIIFTRNTTESLNLLAYSFTEKELEAGDEILISTAEHHSNILPWQQLAKRKDIKLSYLDINENGEIPFKEIKDKINEKTKILSITHMSNVTGIINDIKKITDYAH
ncbi:MAG: aminotransferase class V-fold PLP-dependent enzyme, partial [Bacillota bacterium]